MGFLQRVAARWADTTPGPWFVIGLPWNEGAPFVNAGTADPHDGEVVCDFTYMGYDDDLRETNNSEANAAAVAHAPSDVRLLLNIATAALDWHDEHCACNGEACAIGEALARAEEEA